ncbi:MAG: 50S ribosomal protein P1, partial [Thermoplasmata archaeon]
SNVLKASGIEVDEARVKALVAALEGVNIDEVIKQATAAPVTATAPAASAEAPAQEAAPAEEEKEEKEEEESEEEALAGLGALFG